MGRVETACVQYSPESLKDQMAAFVEVGMVKGARACALYSPRVVRRKGQFEVVSTVGVDKAGALLGGRGWGQVCIIALELRKD